MAGDTVAEEDEYIRVSMISVDEHRTVQSDFEHDSLGIRDCALPECATQSILAEIEDFDTVCEGIITEHDDILFRFVWFDRSIPHYGF